jgi:hypothetical protein
MAISTRLPSEAVGCSGVAGVAITTGANAGRPWRFRLAGLTWSPGIGLLPGDTRAFRRHSYT